MATGGHVNHGEKLFLCSICQEDINVPKTLSCLHAFCKACIAEYIVNTERKSGHKLSNYSCPVCTTVVTPLDPEADVRKWVDELKLGENSNLMVVSDNEIDNYQECHVCKRLNKATRAVNWCRECQEALCDNCTKSHSVMKLSIKHTVVQIDEAMNRCDLTEDITENCPFHESKVVEFYCFDHDEICCGLCCTVNHRKCADVRAVVDIIEDKKVGVDVFKSDLQKYNLSTQNLLESIKEDKLQHEKSFKDIETNVRSSVQTIKDNLDSLLIVFIKELNLKQDEVEILTESDIRKVEDFRRIISKANTSLGSVQKYGTVVQLFVFLNKMRAELGKATESTVNGLNLKAKKVNFVLNNNLAKSLVLESLGKLEDTMQERQFIVDFRRILDGILVNFPRIPIDIVSVKPIKTIFVSDYEIHGGICIDRNHIIICDHTSHKLHIVDVTATLTLRSVALECSPKRLALDEKSSSLFISCYGGYFYRTEIKQDQQSFAQLHEIRGNYAPYVGGVCVHGECAYVVVGKHIKKLEGTQFKSCYDVDTDCMGLSGLAIDKKNRQLVYTSQTFHVIAVSLEGEEIFCYKDDEMKNVTSVAVNSKGLIFAGDESGCVHLISEDGKQRKTLIDKCERITNVRDVWLDNDERRLFVCGNEYVEVYSMEYGQ